MTTQRRAWIASTDIDAIEAYLPEQYRVLGLMPNPDGGDREGVVIEGTDNAGWTLDDYVLPRLASGLYFGREVPYPPFTQLYMIQSEDDPFKYSEMSFACISQMRVWFEGVDGDEVANTVTYYYTRQDPEL